MSCDEGFGDEINEVSSLLVFGDESYHVCKIERGSIRLGHGEFFHTVDGPVTANLVVHLNGEQFRKRVTLPDGIQRGINRITEASPPPAQSPAAR